MKQKITEILQTAPLSISTTRRLNSNGLRNAEEVAELIVAVVGDRESKLLGALKRIAAKKNIRMSELTGQPYNWEIAEQALKELGVE